MEVEDRVDIGMAKDGSGVGGQLPCIRRAYIPSDHVFFQLRCARCRPSSRAYSRRSCATKRRRDEIINCTIHSSPTCVPRISICCRTSPSLLSYIHGHISLCRTPNLRSVFLISNPSQQHACLYVCAHRCCFVNFSLVVPDGVTRQFVHHTVLFLFRKMLFSWVLCCAHSCMPSHFVFHYRVTSQE